MKKLLIISLLLFVACTLRAQVFPCCVISGGSSGGGTIGGGGTYTIEKTVRINLSNEFETSGQQPATPKWNLAGASQTALSAPGGFALSNLVDETGAATTWGMTNLTAFSGNTGSAPSPATANTGIYVDNLIKFAWQGNNTGTDVTIRITNLPAGKYLQISCLGNSDNWRHAIAYWYVGATQSAQINQDDNYGSSANSEFTAAYVGHIKNVQADGSGNLDISMHFVSGQGQPFWNTLVIQQTNIANPN